MTENERQLARHALGLPNKQRKSYRNHFVAGPGHSDFEAWLAMVESGHATRRKGNELSGGDDVFWLTEKGARTALAVREKLDVEDFPIEVRKSGI